ncbi:MAG: dihydrodipicolinate synthase family protein [Alphaproteobacteria bacterium]|nr:dihydrodipicolinate synthase family protein [Alphaproteobacteria bacterium]MBM3628144.1 dihydrodipicolinate synthase family protein [Alphaproteobacteria bacterium]
MTRLLDEGAKGVYIIAATPFADNGALDLDSTDRMTDYYLRVGCDGMTILGVMGEAPKLSPEESAQFAERVLRRVAGRIPVVVGVSAPGMTVMKSLTEKVMQMGAAGVMVAPNAGLKTDEAVEAYYAAVVKSLGADVPIVLQDYPALTGVNMSISCVNRLLKAHDSIKVLKHEDIPGHRKLTKVRAAEASGDRKRRVSILVGNTALYLPQELRRGADGANTGFAYAEMLVEVCRRFFAGDAEGAEDLYDIYLPVVRHEQQPGIGLAIRKEILRRRGVIASAHVRAPGAMMDADDHKELDGLIARLERRLAERGMSSKAAE